jgi:uncharacterized YccA/Bax inhibitor family protein
MSNFDRTSNPAFRSEYFEQAFNGPTAMTIQGTINKIGFLTLLLIAAASFTWKATLEAQIAPQSMILLGGLGGFITALITMFSPTSARFSAPVYAVFEGLFLGAVSALYASMYQGIVLHAILLTLATLGGMLFLFKTGIIKPTESLKAGIASATMGVFFAYLFSLGMSFFGLASPIHAAGPVGIVLSLVVVGIAAFNLILDFDMIVKGAENRAPEHFEWYAAFGLMVTIIWLYLELLRLLAKLQSRD